MQQNDEIRWQDDVDWRNAKSHDDPIDVPSRVSPESLRNLPDAQRRALERLFAEQRKPLMRHLTGLLGSQDDAADILQESFCRLVRHAQTTRLEAVGPGYLFQTATNLARDHFRRRAVRCGDRHVALDDVEEVADGTCVETAAMWDQALAAVKQGLREMPDELREVFVLSRFQGRSSAEIAATFSVSTRTIERRMSEALDFLVARMRGAT